LQLFANEDQLARAILKEDWPQKRSGKPIILPYASLGGLFKGRDEFLKELHASLSRGRGRKAIVGSALYGLGGIGKTRAAVEYAWAHQDDYTALLFAIAETPEALTTQRVTADSYFSVAYFHSRVHDHFKATIDHALSVKRHRVSVRL